MCIRVLFISISLSYPLFCDGFDGHQPMPRSITLFWRLGFFCTQIQLGVPRAGLPVGRIAKQLQTLAGLSNVLAVQSLCAQRLRPVAEGEALRHFCTAGVMAQTMYTNVSVAGSYSQVHPMSESGMSTGSEDSTLSAPHEKTRFHRSEAVLPSLPPERVSTPIMREAGR